MNFNCNFFNFFAEIFCFNFLGWWFVSQKIGRSCWFAIFSTWNLVLAKAISRSDNQRHARISDSVYSFFCCWAFQVRIKTLKMFIRYTLKSKEYFCWMQSSLSCNVCKRQKILFWISLFIWVYVFPCSWLDYFKSYLVNIFKWL